ncbi:MAG TPA: universal stress protein [Longimicrobiales bacterium]|nr:universal stress protein [Longimicrobiales bacterium]
MIQRILVPLDGSSFSEHSLPYALRVAQASGARIDVALVHVRQWPVSGEAALVEDVDRWEAEHRAREADYLHDLAARLHREGGVTVGPELLTGEIVPALERAAKAADLVVMTTHGRAGLERAWLGSVADALVRHVDVPLLLVRPSDDEPVDAAFRHVLLALDGSDTAERCIDPALEVAPDARVTVLRVVAPPAAVASPYIPHAARLTHEGMEDRLATANHHVDSVHTRLLARGRDAAAEVLLDYHEAHAILRFARENDVDLIALGTRGRSPLARLLMGSVSDKVVRGATVPVLVC